MYHLYSSLEYHTTALAGVAQWIEHQPANQRFNSQSGHMPGLRNRSPVWEAGEASPH